MDKQTTDALYHISPYRFDYHCSIALRWHHKKRDGAQITSFTIVYLTVYSDVDQHKHQSSASLAFFIGIHRRPVNFPHKGPVTPKMIPIDDVIMGWNVSYMIYTAIVLAVLLQLNYSALFIYRSHFYLKNSRKTLNSLPLRARYGVSFVSA